VGVRLPPLAPTKNQALPLGQSRPRLIDEARIVPFLSPTPLMQSRYRSLRNSAAMGDAGRIGANPNAWVMTESRSLLIKRLTRSAKSYSRWITRRGCTLAWQPNQASPDCTAGDARTELLKLAVRKIVEEALEAEVAEAFGRGYYEAGAAPGAGYPNGYRCGRPRTAESAIEYGGHRSSCRDLLGRLSRSTEIAGKVLDVRGS
jgi:hypothetical protein